MINQHAERLNDIGALLDLIGQEVEARAERARESGIRFAHRDRERRDVFPAILEAGRLGCRLPRFLDHAERLAVEDRMDEIRRPVPMRKLMLDVQHHE